ncbi:MAG: DNA repair protein RecN [Actinobacteria bacterium]|nr:DNA repair protein RecN [Actinomycetota bacterium]
MISELRIGALGVIESAELPFHPGLNVVTGETGAGKTMVVTGLGLLFGDRADAALVRTGASAASVEGVLELPSEHPGMQRAADAGADVADELILVRTVSAAGRSRGFAGGRQVPIGTLAELAQVLIAVHGQADQWRLRSGDQHRELLDAYGGPDLVAARTAYVQAHEEWGTADAEVSRLEALAAARTADLDVLRAGVERIEAVDPQPGEDLALRAEEARLAHGDSLRAAAATASAQLLGDDAIPDRLGAAGLAADALSAIRAVEEHDPALPELAARLQELSVLASELGGDLSAYADGIEVDEERLAQINERRADLAGLVRAHGGDIDAVIAWSAQASARLLEVDSAADDLPVALERRERAEATRASAADDLSARRQAAATTFAAAVTEELAHLAMGSAVVEVDVRPGLGSDRRYFAHGVDEVEFLMRSGSGMPARPIARSASGGELSRVMLALEVVLGAAGAAATRAGDTPPVGGGASVPTFVFDEVDAGVGGRAALDIGARLARLAGRAQVIVVTHLPQVAAFADRHLVVTKTDDGRISRSDVRVLDQHERERELARMMAGSDSETAIEHARELLAGAQERRAAWDH